MNTTAFALFALRAAGRGDRAVKTGARWIASQANADGGFNFALKGAMKKTLTGVSFTGTKTVTIKLKKGKYTYYCQPHASLMKGSFTVK